MLLRVLHSSFLPRRFVSRRQFCSQPPKDASSQESELKKSESTKANASLARKKLLSLKNSLNWYAARFYPGFRSYARLVKPLFKNMVMLSADQLMNFKAAWKVFRSKEGDIKKTIETIVFGVFDEVCERAKSELKPELNKDAKEIYETKKMELKQEADRVEKSTKENLTDFAAKEEETFKTKCDNYTSGKELEFKETIHNESINELNQFNADMQRTTEIKRDEIKDLLISWVSKSNSDLESKANELLAKLEVIAKESHASCFDEAQEKYKQYFTEKDRLYEQFFESNREVFATFFKKNFEDFESFFAENRKKTLHEILTDYVSRRTDFKNYLIDEKVKFDSYFDEINKSQKSHFDTVTDSIASLHSKAKESLETTRNEANTSLKATGKDLEEQIRWNVLFANLGWLFVLNIIAVLCILLMDYGIYKYYIENILEDSLDALVFLEDFEKRIESSYVEYLAKNNDFSNSWPLKALSFLMTYKFFAALFLHSKSEGGVQLCLGCLGVLCSEYDVALRVFDQVLESKESNVRQINQASYGKAYVFLKQKNLQSALGLITNTLDTLKNSDHKLRVRCLLLQSNILYQLKDHQKAVQVLVDLFNDTKNPCEDSYKVIIQKKLGDYYFSEGKYQKAKDAYIVSKNLSQTIDGSNKSFSTLSFLNKKFGKKFQLPSFELEYSTILLYELEASLIATQFHLIEENSLLDYHQKQNAKKALKDNLHALKEQKGYFSKNIASKLLILDELFKVNSFRNILGITTDYEYAVLNQEIFNNTNEDLEKLGWKVIKDPDLDLNGRIKCHLLHHSKRNEYVYIFNANASYNEILKSLMQNKSGGVVFSVMEDIQGLIKDNIQKEGIKITFTGYAFGALYAEYANWKISENPDVYHGAQFECITFNSPGSATLIKGLVSKNTSSPSQDVRDNFTRSTKIYLPSPDKINTTNQQAVKPVHVFTAFDYAVEGSSKDYLYSVLYYLTWGYLRYAFSDSRQEKVFTLKQIIEAAFDEKTGKIKQVDDYSPALIQRWPTGTTDYIEYLHLESKIRSGVSLQDRIVKFTPDQQNELDRIYCSESVQYRYNISPLQELSPEIRAYLRAYVKTNGTIDEDADSVFLQFSIQNNQIELYSGISIAEFKRYIQFRIGKIGEDKLKDYKTSLFQAQYFTEHYGMLLSRTNLGRDNEDISDLSTANNIKLEKRNG